MSGDGAQGSVVKAEFSDVQLFYVILFTPGLFFFGLYILSFLQKPMPKADFSTTLIIAAVGILFMLLGIAFPFLMQLGRRKVARPRSESRARCPGPQQMRLCVTARRALSPQSGVLK